MQFYTRVRDGHVFLNTADLQGHNAAAATTGATLASKLIHLFVVAFYHYVCETVGAYPWQNELDIVDALRIASAAIEVYPDLLRITKVRGNQLSSGGVRV